jgi:hypothetical protein
MIQQEQANTIFEGMTVLWSGGIALGSKINIDLTNTNLFIHKGAKLLDPKKVNIEVKNFSNVYGNDILLKAPKQNVDASGQSTLEFVNCNFEAPKGFKSDESTFFIRGNETNLKHDEATAEGSGTFIIDDEDGVYF